MLQDYVNNENVKAKQKFYYNYLVLKNDIIMSALKIKITDKYIIKALRLSIIAMSYKNLIKIKNINIVVKKLNLFIEDIKKIT